MTSRTTERTQNTNKAYTANLATLKEDLIILNEQSRTDSMSAYVPSSSGSPIPSALKEHKKRVTSVGFHLSMNERQHVADVLDRVDSLSFGQFGRIDNLGYTGRSPPFSERDSSRRSVCHDVSTTAKGDNVSLKILE
jgi:hypothetical protein